jgi:hypothetical protein
MFENHNNSLIKVGKIMSRELYKSAETVKCPACDFKFIPKYYQLEKVKPTFGNGNHDFKHKLLTFFKLSNGHEKPAHLIRKSWITSCPQCAYILRFAAELGEKMVLNGKKTVFHIGEYKEGEKRIKYDFKSIGKPYKEIIEYDKRYIQDQKDLIMDVLNDLNLHKWGLIYKEWRAEKKIDSFRFLIRFCSLLEEYFKTLNQRSQAQLFSKIEALSFSNKLKEQITEIFELKENSTKYSYDLNEQDESKLKKTYLQLLFELVSEKLKPLKLHLFFNIEGIEDFQKRHYFSEIKKFFFNYFQGNSCIGEEGDSFLTLLLKSLEFPLYDLYDTRSNKKILPLVYLKNIKSKIIK